MQTWLKVSFILLGLSANVSAQESLQHNLLFPENQNFSHTAFRPTFVKTDENGLFNIDGNKVEININPAFDLLYGSSSENISRLGYGADLQLKHKKWDAGFTYMHSRGEYLEYQTDFIRENRVVPAMGVSSGKDKIQANYMNAFVNFKASNIFSFELGYGRQFIGEGYRSLLRSDFGNASPYLKIQTSFWNIQYTNLFAIHENIYNIEGEKEFYQRKFSATHFLDWKIARWISIGLFETVIWQNNQGGYNRGFDVNYLNPVIFYRPVEFSTGSADNVMIGANLKLKPIKNHTLYFQLLFDEFLLDELKADFNQWRSPDQDIRSGWWANKYGIQLGWKANSVFKINGLSALAEFNLVRPYTYAHTNPSQSYSHYNLSLAHPLEANFHEFVSLLSYQKKYWRMAVRYNQSLSGNSPQGTNYGDNLQLSNVSRTKEYENFIGQGVERRVNYLDANVSYLIVPNWKATLSLGYLWREERLQSRIQNERMLYLRFRTNLFNQYFDF